MTSSNLKRVALRLRRTGAQAIPTVIAVVVLNFALLQLVPGDLLTLITDGVPEATQHRELFGFERTAALSTQPAHVIANTAIGFGQADDITVLSVAFQA